MSDYGMEWFMGRMEEKMRENSHKRGWDDIDQHYALDRLREEVEEIAPIVETWDYDPEQARELIRECADVANFAWMLAETARGWEAS